MYSSMKNPLSIDKLLKSGNHELASLVTRARQFAKYNAWLKLQLPSPLHEYCTVADIQGNSLILSVDKAIWATKLRFSGVTIIAQMKLQFPELAQLEQLKVIVLPRFDTQNAPEKSPMHHLSAKNALTIRMLAESISDPKLRAALEKLAQHEEK